MASNDLIWQLVRKHNRFLVKRDGHQFSSEPNNVANKHSYKFSGLANSKAVGVSLAADNKTPQLTLSRPRRQHRVKDRNVVVPLKRHMRKHSCRAAETINALTKKKFYRADLARYAVARYHALKKSVTAPKKTITKPKSKGKRARKAARKLKVKA